MKEHLTIIKVGGKIVENSESLNSLLKDFAAVEGKKLLVHLPVREWRALLSNRAYP